MTALLKLVPELAIVVDLAVEHDPHGPVFVRHGLLTAGQVDDAQTAHAERDAVAEIDAFLVRATMDHDAAHVSNLVLEDGPTVPPHDSGDTAHVIVSLTHAIKGPHGLATKVTARHSRNQDMPRCDPGPVTKD